MNCVLMEVLLVIFKRSWKMPFAISISEEAASILLSVVLGYSMAALYTLLRFVERLENKKSEVWNCAT